MPNDVAHPPAKQAPAHPAAAKPAASAKRKKRKTRTHRARENSNTNIWNDARCTGKDWLTANERGDDDFATEEGPAGVDACGPFERSDATSDQFTCFVNVTGSISTRRFGSRHLISAGRFFSSLHSTTGSASPLPTAVSRLPETPLPSR